MLSPSSSNKKFPIPLPASLPGFDLDKGLIILNGNSPLYARLLNEFYRSYQTAGERLQQNLLSGDKASARLLVHTLKGLAANLAAEDLYLASEDLEKKLQSEINSEKKIPDSDLSDIQSALQHTMKSLSDWQDHHKTKTIAHDHLKIKDSVEMDNSCYEHPVENCFENSLEALIQYLFRQLKTANPQAIDLLPQLAKALEDNYTSQLPDSQLLNTYFLNLERELDRFEFDQAALILAEIQQELSQLDYN